MLLADLLQLLLGGGHLGLALLQFHPLGAQLREVGLVVADAFLELTDHRIQRSLALFLGDQGAFQLLDAPPTLLKGPSQPFYLRPGLAQFHPGRLAFGLQPAPLLGHGVQPGGQFGPGGLTFALGALGLVAFGAEFTHLSARLVALFLGEPQVGAQKVLLVAVFAIV